MDKSKVQPFRRIFKYVWPQWPRLVVIVITAVIIGILFSLSFMTVGPLLKVMLNEEGLHGWADRKICKWRYGMNFYVPDKEDYIKTSDIAFFLLVTAVEDDKPADSAGIEAQDKIFDVAGLLAEENLEQISSAKLLEKLANAPGEIEISLQLRRDDNSGQTQPQQVRLITPKKHSYIGHIQWAMSFVPRGQDRSHRKQTVICIILVMAVVTTARCIATFYQKYLAEKVVQVAIAQVRQKVFAHVMNMPLGFFGTSGTSDTTSRILGDTSATGKGVKVLLGKALREPLKALGTLSGAMLISTRLTLIFLCAAPITITLFGLLGRKIKRASKKSLMSSALMLGKIQDVMNALSVVKVYNRQEQEARDYQTINNTFLRRVLRVAKVQAMTGPMMEWLGMVAGSAALLVGVHWIFSPASDLQPSSFFLLLVLLGTTAESIRKVSDVWNSIQQANAAAERVFEVADRPLEFEAVDAFELPPLRETILFRDVIFSYPGSDKAVLNGINLRVETGQTVAVVGPNGSGKSTLINLIPRFYDLDSGTILIDGQDIKQATLKSLREQIGMVTQNVITFNDTVAANIGYGKPAATRQEIIAAAKRSFSHEFIDSAPDGYETLIGEHGSGFSGGQLQRIVIARAILNNPPILIFDEAMSQVDADSEAKIHQALAGLMKNRTCFVIAHRFSTVISADRIVVMDDGRIVAQGRHEELIKSCGLYKNLYETQLMAPQ
jgi:ABC-type multidrug transport system fused ATPase/permease subunit